MLTKKMLTLNKKYFNKFLNFQETVGNERRESPMI